jgi:peptide subunit release factor 1 (eRF1)
LYDKPQELYGLLQVQGDKCIIQTINEYYDVKTINSKTAKIQKRHKKGGQSQNRIQRLRVETINCYLKAIAEKAYNAYQVDGVPIIKALLICGPGQKKEQLVPYLEKLNINCYIKTTDIPTVSCSNTLNTAVLNHVQHMISTENKSADEKHVSDILELIELTPEVLVFGRQHIDEAQKNNQLSFIYSNKKLSYKTIIVNHHMLDSFDGCIGVRYYA